MSISPASTFALWVAVPASLAAAGLWTLPSGKPGSGPVATVSQKGRMFSVASVELRAGESIRIVNDDADLQHHAYVDSNTFKFDSGDQPPGSKTDIAFPVSGTFAVQCGIHPKMKMTVTVR